MITIRNVRIFLTLAILLCQQSVQEKGTVLSLIKLRVTVDKYKVTLVTYWYTELSSRSKLVSLSGVGVAGDRRRWWSNWCNAANTQDSQSGLLS